MKSQDTRVKYTKMILHQAMLSMLREMPISKITVTALCEKADLNRGTFYLHYNTPEDLMSEIEEEFWNELMSVFEPFWNSTRNVDVLSILFSSIMDKKEVTCVLLGCNGNPSFVKRLQELVKPYTIAKWKKEFPDCTEATLSFVFEFVFSGSTTAILNWIENDDVIDSQQFARQLELLGHYCLVAGTQFAHC